MSRPGFLLDVIKSRKGFHMIKALVLITGLVVPAQLNSDPFKRQPPLQQPHMRTLQEQEQYRHQQQLQYFEQQRLEQQCRQQQMRRPNVLPPPGYGVPQGPPRIETPG